MALIKRDIASHAEALHQLYPVLTLTGPRQAGKTTLCRSTFPDLPYVNLEAPDVREAALDDPRGLLRRFPDGAILDEVQRAPELMSYLQPLVDEDRRNGLFVVTGSQQLEVTASVTQSLAGRTGILRLLPLSIGELCRLNPPTRTDDMLFAGFYPRLHEQGIPPRQGLGDYIETYVERDLRQLSAIHDLGIFHRFVRLCAGRTAQVLNVKGLGEDAGISHTTAGQWLDLLEASYVCFRLRPLHVNVSKRLIKSPKLYFYDVGVASYLLGMRGPDDLSTHPLRGALFENLVVVEALKALWNAGERPELYFYRESTGSEVDLVLECGMGRVAIEVKSTATFAPRQLDGLRKFRKATGAPGADILVVDGDETFQHHGCTVTHPAAFAEVLLGAAGIAD
jgi:predicted AAA+ superfamily ATPase